MIEYWGPVAAFFVAAASPGPATLAVASAAMSSGVRPAMWLSLGLALSLGAAGALVALGLAPLLIASASAQWVMRVLGGLFLLYLAWSSLQSALRDTQGKTPARAQVVRATSPLRMMMQGILLNGLNPKAALAWAAVIAMGGAADAETVWTIVGLCSTLGLLIYASYAVLFAAPRIRRAYDRARRWVDGIVAIGFGAAGAALLASRG